MTANRHARVKQLFLAVIELPVNERGLWLENECADDPSLRTEVEALLAQQTTESSKPARSQTTVTCDPLRTKTVGNPDGRNSQELQAIPVDDAAEARPPGTMIADRYRIV